MGETHRLARHSKKCSWQSSGESRSDFCQIVSEVLSANFIAICQNKTPEEDFTWRVSWGVSWRIFVAMSWEVQR